MTDYESALARLAECRTNRKTLADREKQALSEWQKANADIILALNAAIAAEGAAEGDVRTLALARYEVEGKKSLPGVTIRITKRLIYEADKALAWAKEHGLFLALDRRGFETMAKSTDIDFVGWVEEPQAAIDSDLSAWLVKGA